ncbi:MAG: DUF4113 domain-containing protein [Bacteroidales bacterium]|nr:DUF4113 domain-containing protein [Bacteroidales bacterium]
MQITRKENLPKYTKTQCFAYYWQILENRQKHPIIYYKKAGVIVTNISEDSAVQGSLFDTVDRDKQSALSKVVDEINLRNGHDMVRVAVQGYDNSWHIKNEYISKQYTTNIKDILVVKA